MPDIRLPALGAHILRITLGLIMLAHSVILKLMTFGLEGTAAFFVAHHLPGWLAYLTFTVEAVGGLLLVIGVRAREVALALLPFMLGALFTVHAANGWVFDAPGGGWEYPALLALLCVVQALLASSPEEKIA